MERTEAEEFVCSFLSKKKPLLHRTRQKLLCSGGNYRICPEEQFDFGGGHLPVELEATRRPVESVSKYWWLMYRTDYPRTSERIALVLVILRSDTDPIRSDSAELLGRKLEEELPDLFRFFFVPAQRATRDALRRVLADAQAAVAE